MHEKPRKATKRAREGVADWRWNWMNKRYRERDFFLSRCNHEHHNSVEGSKVKWMAIVWWKKELKYTTLQNKCDENTQEKVSNICNIKACYSQRRQRSHPVTIWIILEENSENIYNTKKICFDEKCVFATGCRKKKRNFITNKSLDWPIVFFWYQSSSTEPRIQPTKTMFFKRIVIQPLLLFTVSLLSHLYCFKNNRLWAQRSAAMTESYTCFGCELSSVRIRNMVNYIFMAIYYKSLRIWVADFRSVFSMEVPFAFFLTNLYRIHARWFGKAF